MSVNSTIRSLGWALPSPLRAGLGEFSQFMRWWMQTLASLIPSLVRNSLFAQKENPALRFVDGAYVLGDDPLDNPSIQSRKLEGSPFDLILPMDQIAILRRNIPTAAIPRAPEIMALKAQAETPFRAEDVNQDVRIVEHLEDKTSIVELALITKTRAEQHRVAVEELGLRLAAIDVLQSDGTRAGLDLNRTRIDSFEAKKFPFARLLVFGVVALSAIWLAGIYIQQGRVAADVSAKTQQLRPQAETAIQSQTTLYALIENLEDFERRVASPIKFQDAYQEITRVTPDHSWLGSLTYTGDKMVLSGLSENPEDLLAKVNESELVAEAKFTSSLVRDARHAADRFRLEVTLIDVSVTEDGAS